MRNKYIHIQYLTQLKIYVSFKESVSRDFSGPFFACMDRSRSVLEPLTVFNFFLLSLLFYIYVGSLDKVNAKSKWLNNVQPHFSANQY